MANNAEMFPFDDVIMFEMMGLYRGHSYSIYDFIHDLKPAPENYH